MQKGTKTYRKVRKEMKLIDLLFHLPNNLSLISRSSDNEKHRKHVKTKRVGTKIPEADEEWKDGKRNHKKSSLPSTSVNISPASSSLDREPLLPNVFKLELGNEANRAEFK